MESNHLSTNPTNMTAQLANALGGVGGGGSNADGPAPSATEDTTPPPQRHFISAESSVSSSTASLTSSKTAVSALPPPAIGPSLSLPGGGAGAVAPSSAPPQSAPAPAATAPVPGVDPMAMPMNAPPHPVAEFLFQLTKMLTDSNSKYIEWRNASIFVHDPPGLEKDILPKYFRHSNYSSFQRQMNYFGFRKIAGKGKMAPCSYVNEAAKEDISSLLFIKRKKTGVSSAAAKLMAQQNRINRSLGVAGFGLGGVHGGIGLGAGASLLGGALPSPASQANSSLTINNFMVGAGGNNLMPSTAGGAGSLLSAGTSQGHNETNNLLSHPQNMLAQLQQAHAAALMSSQVQNAGGGSGGVAQATQNKSPHDIGTGMSNNINVGANNILLTNDQGNVYTNQSNPNGWSTSADAAAQSLFFQQATQGLGGNSSQATGASAAAADSNGMVRLDSAANLRALINQQISMFNAPAAGDFASALGAAAAAPLGAGISQAPGPAAPSSQPANAGLNTLSAAPGAVPGFDWNEMIQRMGGGGGAADASAAAAGTLQQLLQGSNCAAPGPAAGGPPFDFSGLFGSGGAANAPQGSFPSC